MKKRGKKGERFENPLLNPPKKFTMAYFFGTSHFVLGLFAALGVLVASSYLSRFFSATTLSFLLIYFIIHLGLALDYYFDRNLDEKFLLFFYVFSIVAFFLYYVFGLY